MDIRPVILVLAGVNGAGKSSILGSIVIDEGLTFFNPDAFAREYLAMEPGREQSDANSVAWNYGKESLEAAIAQKSNFAFETTLGAKTIPNLLLEATETHDVKVLYCGLENVEMNIARVQQRVAQGGHDIPEEKIRERWTNSIANLIMLMPHLSELKVFDNSTQVQVNEELPDPIKVLAMSDGRITFPNLEDVNAMNQVKEWVKPLLMAAEDLNIKNTPKI